MMADEVLPMPRIEGLAPTLTVRDFVTDDEICHLQNPVRDHNCRPFLVFPTGKAAEFGAESGLFGMARCVGTCDEDRPEPLVAFAGVPTLALAGTLIVPWT